MNNSLKVNFELNSAAKEFFEFITEKSELPNRPKLTVETFDYFTKILQNAGQVKCILRSKGVGTKKPGSRKGSSPVFKGLFHCLRKDCKIVYRIMLQSASDPFINFSWTGDSICKEAFKNPQRITGEKRKELSHKISAFNVTKSIDKKINNGK